MYTNNHTTITMKWFVMYFEIFNPLFERVIDSNKYI